MSHSFSRALSLKIHIWTDSGEKTLCKQCSKYFTGTGQLRILMRTHSEGKLYCCKQCSKSFTGSGDLRKHILINSETICLYSMFKNLFLMLKTIFSSWTSEGTHETTFLGETI